MTTHAIITGGANGIGAATARKLLKGGAEVTVLDIDTAAGGQLIAEQAPAADRQRLHFATADVCDAAGVTAAIEAAIARAGRLDVLVNNAGVAAALTVKGIDANEWQRVMGTNLQGVFTCVQAALPAMRARKSGAIVNLASIAAKNISLGAGAHYTASKWGVLGMTRHLAYELAPYGIRVNAVCPGPVATAFIPMSPDALRAGAHGIPLGRWVSVEDVANAIAFFAGPESAMCTGSDLVVDGGVMLGSGNTYENYFSHRGEQAPERDVTYPE